VAAKATEGTGFADAAYADFKAQAARIGAVFWAYHFLHAGNAAAQAAHAHAVAGDTPLMLDWEPYAQIGSAPTVADAVGFVDAYRLVGGRVWAVYLPHWYWAQLGSPSLAPVAQRGLALVSSNYPPGGYSDTGPGWAAYGGVSPSLWQYTDAQPYGGRNVDFNAYRGSVAQLSALVNGAPAPVPQSEPVPGGPVYLISVSPDPTQGGVKGTTGIFAVHEGLGPVHVDGPTYTADFQKNHGPITAVSPAYYAALVAAVPRAAVVLVDAATATLIGDAIAAKVKLPSAIELVGKLT
jgi:hypothetical protein